VIPCARLSAKKHVYVEIGVNMAKRIDKLRPLLRSPFEWMTWLVRFSNYGNCTPRERRALRDVAQGFTKGVYTQDGGTPALTDEQMRALALEVNSALRCCARRPPLVWRVPQKIDAANKDKDKDKDKDKPLIDIYAEPGKPLSYVSHGFQIAFFLHVAELISNAGRSVRVCARPGCSNLFTALRTGDYCSRRCAQYVHTTSYRARKRDRAFARLLRGISAAKAEQLIEGKRAREEEKKAKRPERAEREAGWEPEAWLGVMENPATVKVKSPKDKEGWVRMNASDYDPGKHELFEEQAKPKVAAHRRHHEPKPAQPRRAVVH
jgi:hypothetical protein